MFAYQAADAFAFVTHNQSQWAGQISLCIKCLCFSRQPDDPDILLFQIVNGTCQIGLACNQQVFAGTCRCFDNGGVDLGSPVLWNNNAMHACSLGGTE